MLITFLLLEVWNVKPTYRLILACWDVKPTYWKSLVYESSNVFTFGLGPLLQGQTMVAKLKLAYNSFIIGLTVLICETNL